MIRVIVIDDDIDTAEVLKEYLTVYGFEVSGIGYNGSDAVELYKKYQPDVVFLDVMMPDFDGFYGLRNIRYLDSKAKVIMVTADLTEETEEKLETLQASGIAYKPYDIENLVDLTKKILNEDSPLISQSEF